MERIVTAPWDRLSGPDHQVSSRGLVFQAGEGAIFSATKSPGILAQLPDGTCYHLDGKKAVGALTAALQVKPSFWPRRAIAATWLAIVFWSLTLSVGNSCLRQPALDSGRLADGAAGSASADGGTPEAGCPDGQIFSATAGRCITPE